MFMCRSTVAYLVALVVQSLQYVIVSIDCTTTYELIFDYFCAMYPFLLLATTIVNYARNGGLGL